MAYIDDVYSVVKIQPTGIEAFVRLSQNENGRRLIFAITGGEIPTGSTATLSGTKPDGVVYSTTGTISGNVVTVLEDIQLTAAAGPWPAKLRILNGGNVVATGRIRFVIDKDPVAAGAVPSDSQLEGLVAEAAAYAEAAKDGAYYGSPLTASTVAGMTDKNRVYVYTGSESGYTAGNWYYWNGSAWTSGGVYNSQGIQTDKTLTVTGMAADAKAVGDALKAVQVETDKTLTQADVPADAKVVGDEIADLKAELEQMAPGVWSDDAKEALLACFQNIAFLNDDDDYYGNLRDALYGEEPEPTEGTVEISDYVIGNFNSINNQILYDGTATNRIYPNPILYKTKPGNVVYTATLNNSNYRVTIGRIKSTAENDSLVTQGVTKTILSSFTERDGSTLPWSENTGSLNVEGYDYIMPSIKRADDGNMTAADLQAIQNAYTLTWKVVENG